MVVLTDRQVRRCFACEVADVLYQTFVRRPRCCSYDQRKPVRQISNIQLVTPISVKVLTVDLTSKRSVTPILFARLSTPQVHRLVPAAVLPALLCKTILPSRPAPTAYFSTVHLLCLSRAALCYARFAVQRCKALAGPPAESIADPGLLMLLPPQTFVVRLPQS